LDCGGHGLTEVEDELTGSVLVGISKCFPYFLLFSSNSVLVKLVELEGISVNILNGGLVD
jgi:hypothetical protein